RMSQHTDSTCCMNQLQRFQWTDAGRYDVRFFASSQIFLKSLIHRSDHTFFDQDRRNVRTSYIAVFWLFCIHFVQVDVDAQLLQPFDDHPVPQVPHVTKFLETPEKNRIVE